MGLTGAQGDPRAAIGLVWVLEARQTSEERMQKKEEKGSVQRRRAYKVQCPCSVCLCP